MKSFSHLVSLVTIIFVIIIKVTLVKCFGHFDDSSSHSHEHGDDNDGSEEFSSCTTLLGDTGICKRLSRCPPEHWTHNRRDICSFSGGEKIVCCFSRYRRGSYGSYGNRHNFNSNEVIDTRDKLNSVSNDNKKLPNKLTTGKRISETKFEEYMNKIFTKVQATERISGRIPTLPGEYPHMSAIGFKTAQNRIDWKCGGNLISEYFVLTAAHCVSDNGREAYLVRIGDLNLLEEEIHETPQTFHVKSTHMYPTYNSSSYYNDIGLIELSKGIVLTEFVRPACLWSHTEIPHENVIAMGYGSSEFGGIQTKTLSELSLSIISNEECNRRLPPQEAARDGVLESQICALDPTGQTDTCQGDSGGPLQYNVPRHRRTYYYIVGITSFGIFCGGRFPSVYTRISYYVDWIEKIVWS